MVPFFFSSSLSLSSFFRGWLGRRGERGWGDWDGLNSKKNGANRMVCFVRGGQGVEGGGTYIYPAGGGVGSDVGGLISLRLLLLLFFITFLSTCHVWNLSSLCAL